VGKNGHELGYPESPLGVDHADQHDVHDVAVGGGITMLGTYGVDAGGDLVGFHPAQIEEHALPGQPVVGNGEGRDRGCDHAREDDRDDEKPSSKP
jgi:hypothetical protein